MLVNGHHSNPPSIGGHNEAPSVNTQPSHFPYFAIGLPGRDTSYCIPRSIRTSHPWPMRFPAYGAMFALFQDAANAPAQESSTLLAETRPIHNRVGTQQKAGAWDWFASQLYVWMAMSRGHLHPQTNKPHVSKTDEKKRTATY